MQRILAASDFSTRSHRAVRRAGLLARQSQAELVLLHVVDDDQPATLIELEQREASRILAEQLDSIVELRETNSRFIVTGGDPFDAIVRTAGATSADLIVMGAHRKVLLRDIFVGTTIERVVRTAARRSSRRRRVSPFAAGAMRGSASTHRPRRARSRRTPAAHAIALHGRGPSE